MMSDEGLDEQNNGTEDRPAAEESKPLWMLDENTPGVGERPEWLPEKFKSVSDLSNSYRELEKKMVGNVPKEYDFSSAKNIDSKLESMNELSAFAKENRISQKVMDKFVQTMDGLVGDNIPNPTKEFEKLGKGANERLEVLDNWVENNLDPENAKSLFEEINSAKGIQALEQLRNNMMNNDSNVPNGNEGSSSDNAETLDDLQSELITNLDKYKSDDNYRKDLRARMSKFAQDSNYVDKAGR